MAIIHTAANVDIRVSAARNDVLDAVENGLQANEDWIHFNKARHVPGQSGVQEEARKVSVRPAAVLAVEDD